VNSIRNFFETQVWKYFSAGKLKKAEANLKVRKPVDRKDLMKITPKTRRASQTNGDLKNLPESPNKRNFHAVNLKDVSTAVPMKVPIDKKKKSKKNRQSVYINIDLNDTPPQHRVAGPETEESSSSREPSPHQSSDESIVL